ncbi:MAG: recombinase family protein, partial [Microcystaceae cyanobacterium]
MRILAYVYSDRLLESPPDHLIWGVEVEQIYSDWGSDQQLQKLLQDCQLSPPDYLLLRRLDELGLDLLTIRDRLENLEKLGIEIIAIEQNYSSHQGRATDQIKARQQWFELIPEIQKYQQIQRQKQGHARNRIQALPPPGKAPYGYQRSSTGYILDQQTAAIIKDFFDDYLLNGSLRQAVRCLEKRHG